LWGGGGSDTIDGGQGYDLVSYQTSTVGVSVTLNDTLDGVGVDGFGGFDVLRSIEGVRGSAHNDVLTGSNTAAYESFEGREGNDTIDGLGGTDRVDYVRSKAGVVVNLATGTASDGYGGTDTLTRIENVRGSTFNDTLTGDANANWLEGQTGNDTMTGGAGNDVFAYGAGGAGIDTITDFAAGDVVGIGAALTTGSATAGNGSAVTGKNVQVSSSGGVTTLWIDTNNVAGAELQIQLTGTFTAGQFTVKDNGNGTSSITRTSGLSIVGTTGADLLSGGVGDDTLDGQAGNDTLDGAGGADRMVGRAGNDTYVVDDAGDTVVEFASEGADTILSSINLFTSNPLAGNVENLTLTGSSDLQGTGNALANVITGNGGHNLLRGDAGHDSLAGGDGNDTLDGGTGNDTLEGGTGADRMVGRVGDDLYFVDDALDVIVEFGGEGVDTVRSSVTYALADTLEHLTLTGSANIDATGNYLGNVLIGNSGANYLRGGPGGVDTMTGGEGNDTLDGGTGADNATGGLGNDTYVVDNTGDIVTELADEGLDTVLSSVTHVLGANVENLTLTGTIAAAGFGNGLNNSIIGNAIANQLNGNAGDDSIFGGAGLDTLDGGLGNDTLDGGTGGDRMVGRAGDDTYIVDNAGDVIVEFAGEGIDTVISSATAALANNVENLTLTGTAHLSAYGNVLANTLTGNAGDNFLRGDLGHDSLVGGAGNDTIDAGTGDDTIAGGTGSDRMVGRTGNDQYWIDDAGDVIVEFLGEGVDVVNSSISYTLADTLETLVLVGASHINAVGSVYANTLVGNDGNNSLSGGMGLDTLSGGAGDDTLDGGTGGDRATGGAGNDTYIVDNAADVVIEVAAEGSDTILSSVTFLAAAFIENLTLTGSNAISAFGNELANQIVGNGSANLLRGADGDDTLVGNGGADTLDGGNGSDVLNGGEGADRLVGRDGADVFAFLTGSGTDTIVDFSLAQGDKIRLSVGINSSGIVDAASALAAASASGADTLIALGSGNTVTLVGVNVASLTTMDFEVS
jgi:Ca2+-binding RTX toxin-like protein